MKIKIIFLLVVLFTLQTNAQVSGSFVVKGDIDKYYPVTFLDGAWGANIPTELKIGRSGIHTDSDWRGSLMSSFRYHTSSWGNGSNFIDADITSSNNGYYSSFIASWRDATPNGNCQCIIIWLRGGTTTYFYQSNYAVNPVVYDGIQNPLPYNEMNGPAHSFKTTPDGSFVSAKNILQNLNVAGNVGIGTTTPAHKLSVNGTIWAKEVKVSLTDAADWVFDTNYKLKPLAEVEKFINENKHLPEVPSAEEFRQNDMNVSQMSNKLLQKIEELTLYAIEQNKKLEEQQNIAKEQNKVIEELKVQVATLINKKE